MSLPFNTDLSGRCLVSGTLLNTQALQPQAGIMLLVGFVVQMPEIYESRGAPRFSKMSYF
jgi:hypothetical protein